MPDQTSPEDSAPLEVGDTALQTFGSAFDDDEGRAARASAEPQEFYLRKLTECPVIHNADGSVQLMRMDDIIAVNKRRDVENASKFLGSERVAIPLGLDGPEHVKYRRLLDPVFTLRRMSSLEPNVRELADELIDGFIDAGEANVYQVWCQPLPSMIFLSILGLPSDDLDDFIRFKDMTLGIGLPDDASGAEAVRGRDEAAAWIQTYFNEALERREASGEPGDDMIGWLLSAEVDGTVLTREELIDILGLLVVAGLDTVAASLACMLSFLARHPEHRARVVAEPSLWPEAVEELLRFETPVTDGGRIATSDIILPSGVEIGAGTAIDVSWSAANVDPEFYPNPLSVDFARTPNRHSSFAVGFHRCLGSHLARLELRVALETFHRRIPDYEINPGVELVYKGNPRTPHNLELVWA